MKVVHLSISRRGGAGRAAWRTVQALRARAVEAELWTADANEISACRIRGPRWSGWRSRLARWPLFRYPRRRLFSEWSNSVLPSRIGPKIAAARADLVHLHWVGGGFFSLDEIAQFDVPTVWTLHDAWPFTGGCHYPADCCRFRAGCGNCPQLGSTTAADLSARNLLQKKKMARPITHWIAPSTWLRDLATSSDCVPAERTSVVPNGLDERVFTVGNRVSTRRTMDLPQDAIVFIAGAVDLSEARKGGALLAETVRHVQRSMARKCVLLVFGRGANALPAEGIDLRALGSTDNEHALVEFYRAADVLLLPSLQDNLPNVAMEAQACGCPTVAFDSGGIRDIVSPGVTGAIAKEINAHELAAAAMEWLGRDEPRDATAKRCRSHFERHFTYDIHAQQVHEVYKTALRTASKT